MKKWGVDEMKEYMEENFGEEVASNAQPLWHVCTYTTKLFPMLCL